MSFLNQQKEDFTQQVFSKEDEFHKIYKDEIQQTQLLVLELKRLKDFSHHLDSVSHQLDLKEQKLTDLHDKKVSHHQDMINSVKNKN